MLARHLDVRAPLLQQCARVVLQSKECWHRVLYRILSFRERLANRSSSQDLQVHTLTLLLEPIERIDTTAGLPIEQPLRAAAQTPATSRG